MCGIAGVVGEVGDRERRSVRRMCEAMRHRGPDDEGYFDAPSVCLGMRRLSIIDVSHGQQPVFSESGTVAGVFNGEAYNFRDIQAALRARGHHLESDSDSECLPHLYEDFGTSMVDELRGMFALALWDSDLQLLLLARDRVGKKPLFYFLDGPRLWFASELKCLLGLDSVPREVNPLALDAYLTFQYVPHPLSIIDGIKKLSPAHTLTWRDGDVHVEQYWKLEYAKAGAKSSYARQELSEQLRQQLLEATQIRLVSERPIGAFLSGGLDSSAVVAAMSRVSSEPVHTFSIGFEEDEFNELPHARRVAELYGTNHEELVVRPHVTELLPRLARMFDEPFADSSAVPSYYVAEMARRSAVVVLNGDGGDEAFGGYTRYAHALRIGGGRPLPRLLTRSAQVGARTLDGRFPSSHLMRRAQTAARLMSEPDPALRYGRLMSYFRPEERLGLYRDDFNRQLAGFDSYEVTRSAWDAAGTSDPVNRLLATDMQTYLPGDLLPKVDITTMAVSLEARSPLLDQKLLEWAAGLPGDLKVQKGHTKTLMKEAMAPWLPAGLIHRRKMGFGIPMEKWLRGPLKEMVSDLLLGPSTRVTAYLDGDELRRRYNAPPGYGFAANQVWALLMLELWLREVLDSGPNPA